MALKFLKLMSLGDEKEYEGIIHQVAANEIIHWMDINVYYIYISHIYYIILYIYIYLSIYHMCIYIYHIYIYIYHIYIYHIYIYITYIYISHIYIYITYIIYIYHIYIYIYYPVKIEDDQNLWIFGSGRSILTPQTWAWLQLVPTLGWFTLKLTGLSGLSPTPGNWFQGNVAGKPGKNPWVSN